MRQDVEHGEGAILRDVTLQVDDVLWSSGGAARPAPASFDWTAYGWTFRGGNPDNRTEMAGADEPRIEKGHTYIMAIEWQPPRCTPGDFVPAQWRGLGDGSTLPFDDKTIGNGEMEGHDQSVEQARSAADTSDPNYGLKDRMAGGSADALAKALGSATPQARKEFDPPLSQTSCG
ncbi:MAG TPA: hypothetical protein VFJ19_06425 [Nocardioidaceae bacterium]|nr:hypothetical protein [Nocardioidaceae bacterium]